MNGGRIEHHPILGPMGKRKRLTFTFDGKTMEALQGETLAAALLANGIRILRRHEKTGTPRGIYCNIGHCFECRLKVNGREGVRACLTTVEEGMKVESGNIIEKGEYP